MKLRAEDLKVYKIVETPNQVLGAIKEFEEEIGRGEHKQHLKTTKNNF